jgi:hypothetical protein
MRLGVSLSIIRQPHQPVEVLLHTGILPLEWGFALVIRRELRSFKPSLGIFREMTVLVERVDKRSWGTVKQPFHLR